MGEDIRHECCKDYTVSCVKDYPTEAECLADINNVSFPDSFWDWCVGECDYNGKGCLMIWDGSKWCDNGSVWFWLACGGYTYTNPSICDSF